ncbi:ATP-binding cassette domain-containing protein [Paludibacterium yongneupense]|uniref:ATP-binding cassette domain-containing protein n=1 Tax=Paludibacterium yongneupense TaxID=400061 RepID=UPI0004111D94|nr:ATP-binding cassette domain-containing protein [Paludibacterium yongneupense]
MDTEFAIRADGLEKRFPGAGPAAIAGIDLRLRRGLITGLAGPDGAGKTTLLRLCAGLLGASGGTLAVEGHDPGIDAARLHDIIGYMPQKFGLYEDLTVLENLELYADLRQIIGTDRRERFDRLLDFTDLERFTSRAAGKLSGGMKQKLGLACALLGTPRVLLLDEPSVGVDPISRRELWSMVKTLAHDGMTVLWSTSYLDEAEACDEVCLMHAGRIAYAGPPQTLMGRMEGRSVQIRDIEGSRRQLLQRIQRRDDIIDAVIQGRQLRLVLAAGAALPDPGELGAGTQARVVPVAPRLEDAFIDLAGAVRHESQLAARLTVRPLPDGVDDGAVIEAQALTRRFGDFVATDHIDFRVARGEIFGLLGPNGAGKSTTFKMMCGLLAPSAGRAQVMGLDLQKSPSRARQQIGYMAQKFSLYGQLNILQNLRFFSGVYGLSGRRQRERIAEMVDIFSFGDYLEQDAGQLPLGIKQRLALACALMHAPGILFLDEPTSGVDPATRREFWSHINGLVDKGVTVMVTTHFMDEAEYCDRIGLVYRGRMIASGTPDALKQLAATADMPDPGMEAAFIRLIENDDSARRPA